MLRFAQHDNEVALVIGGLIELITFPWRIKGSHFDCEPMGRRQFYVYILTNGSRMLYTGMTNNLLRRMDEHKRKWVKGFASKYNLTLLAYYETANNPRSAIAREKQIKGWLRKKKIALIESLNPRWEDLSAGWFDREAAWPRSE
jgi:putative endonuclease